MKPQMTCDRALACLGSLAAGEPSFTSPEVDELLRYGLLLEIDSRDLETLQWLVPALEEHAHRELRDADAGERIKAELDLINEHLRSDWFRLMHGKATIAKHEADRGLLRRVYAIASDGAERERLSKLIADARAAGNPPYVACPALGREQFGLTRKGQQVGADLQLKLSRFTGFPFAVFMKSYDKVDAKMAALVRDVEQLHHSVAGTAKHPHQVVIGLVKSGLPPDQAIHSYASVMRKTLDPSVAVTHTRNASASGGLREAEQQLKAAQHALAQAGIPMTQVGRGVAKSLLGFPSLVDAAHRFQQLANRLEAVPLTTGDDTLKMAARLMPAPGSPDDAVRRARLAVSQLPSTYGLVSRVTSGVQLAALADNDAAMSPLTQRLVDIVNEMVRRKLYRAPNGVLDALECVGCAGTPAEVVETVATLVGKLDASMTLGDGGTNTTAIAVAFAKRFAY